MPVRYFNFGHDCFLPHSHQLLITRAINGRDIVEVPFNIPHKKIKNQTHSAWLVEMKHWSVHIWTWQTKIFLLYSRYQNVNTARTMLYIYTQQWNVREHRKWFYVWRSALDTLTVQCFVVSNPSSFAVPSVSVQLKWCHYEDMLTQKHMEVTRKTLQ